MTIYYLTQVSVLFATLMEVIKKGVKPAELAGSSWTSQASVLTDMPSEALRAGQYNRIRKTNVHE